MQHCFAFIKGYKRVSLLPIEFCSYNVWFYQLRHRLHVCLRALKRKYIWSDLHFILDEKVKILHFYDEDKSWRPSVLYHSVANAIYTFWFWYFHNLPLTVFRCKPFVHSFFRFLLFFYGKVFVWNKGVMLAHKQKNLISIKYILVPIIWEKKPGFL